MKKFIVLIVALFYSTSFFAVSREFKDLSSIEASYQQEDRTVSQFDGINVGGPFNVLVSLGTKEEIRLEGDKEIISRIETKVQNGILKIGFRDRTRGWNWNSGRNERVKIHVTVRSLKSLSVSGSGNVKVEGTIKGDRFSAAVSGSGGLTVNTQTNSFTGTVSGSGSIAVTGSSASGDITVSGSGNLRGQDFRVRNAEIRVSGSGGVTIHAEDHLEAVLSGSGNIRYGGNPHVDVTKSGSGSVSKI